MCQCDCGEIIITRIQSLYSGNTRSCGCLFKERAAVSALKHGKTKSTEYNIWHGINQRCTNPNNPDFPSYSQRGICEQWKQGNDRAFEQFLTDMGPRPSIRHSVERINNDGPYAPENCRWATQPEQRRNTSTNRYLTLDGKTQCISAWAEETGLHKETIRCRLKKGWSVEEALRIPRLNGSGMPKAKGA